MAYSYLQTRRTSAIMYIGKCSVPRFEGRFIYSDIPVMLSLGREFEFVYSTEERWCYNTGQYRSGKTRRMIDDTSLGNCPSFRAKKTRAFRRLDLSTSSNGKKNRYTYSGGHLQEASLYRWSSERLALFL